jgi:hypothetical protein
MFRIRLCGFLAALCLMLLSACAKTQPTPPDNKGSGGGNETLRGKVTYKGKPVPYGLVAVFTATSIDPKTGLFTPTAIGAIGEDGSYEIVRLPAGGAEIAILTSPDVESSEMLHPMMHGEDPSTGAVGPPGTPPAPPIPSSPTGPGPTGTWNLTEEQKKDLRAIHHKYGGYGKNNFVCSIVPGEQTFNIELK